MSRSSSSTSYQLVDSPASLANAVSALENAPLDPEGRRTFFIDTEFESKKSGTRLCLLQISTGAEIYLIDPIVVRDLRPLVTLLREPEATWVLHAGMQDVELLSDKLHIPRPQRLLDTQVAWALLGPEAGVSLAYVQYKICGVRSGKGHQADDWVRRPLPDSQLRYAAADVKHLPAIYRDLVERALAKDQNRLSLLYEASREGLQPQREPPPPLRLENFRNAWQLDARGQAALSYLISWYNGLSPAQRKAAPENKALLAIAARLPRSQEALGRIKGVAPGFLRHHGRSVVEGLSAAADAATGESFTPLEPPAYASFEEIRLEAWLHQLRATVCSQLEVAPELALPSRLLKRMQTAYLVEGPRALRESLVGFRKRLLTESIESFCETSPPPL